MKYMIFKDVVTVQGHSAVLLLQVGSTVLCLGDSGRSNEGAILEIRLFAPMAKKWLAIKWRGLTMRAADGLETCPNCHFILNFDTCPKCGEFVERRR